MHESANQNKDGKEAKAKDCNMGEDGEKERVIEIYRKLSRLPDGSMIGTHQLKELKENEQDQVVLSLVVTKGARKFGKATEMLRNKWKWYSRDKLIEIFNSETELGKAIFKATYL